MYKDLDLKWKFLYKDQFSKPSVSPPATKNGIKTAITNKNAAFNSVTNRMQLAKKMQRQLGKTINYKAPDNGGYSLWDRNGTSHISTPNLSKD